MFRSCAPVRSARVINPKVGLSLRAVIAVIVNPAPLGAQTRALLILPSLTQDHFIMGAKGFATPVLTA